MERVTRLRSKMAELNMDAFIITQPENRRYLSGFTGSSGIVFITPTALKLATDFRYFEQVKKQCPDFELLEVRQGLQTALPAMLAGLEAQRLAFEADDVTYDLYQTLSAALPAGAELCPTKDVVRWLRAVKEPGEIEMMQRAIAWTDQAITTVTALLRPGMTEREVAWKLEATMREAGAEGVSFELIVAAGPAGAMPHARPTERPIQAGEPIVIDMGCKVGGYCSDLTRTYILGEPDTRFNEIYALVRRAQQEAAGAVMPGMLGKAADGVARQIIADAGYGAYFGHGLGHGVGLAVHELPNVGMTSEHVLQAGHVFSIEPGVYLPEWGGVRIEDLALLSEGGARILSQASKEPVIPLR